ncbi:hypothetical protein B0H66DRAFT_188922 [Apodospora peruviana]|uniref:Ribosomal protein S17 n=1 Tax=Apodospora peruviana TaxID=516989 RepID=A0AAE0IBW2_9PEZI|nr:hypothetical protein B0H66DRAFT_188922 [Apodospora peruviana]
MASLVDNALAKTFKSFRELHGVVVTAGLMSKTVKVRVGGTKWNSFLKKDFKLHKTYLVHDPNDSLRAGDVVAITPGWRTSKSKRHVVKRIIAPAKIPIEERPPIPSEEERWAEMLVQKTAKKERKDLRRQTDMIKAKLEHHESLARKLQKQIVAFAKLHGGRGVKTPVDL